MLFFKLSPADGLEPYLGAAGHMLVASEDLIDMIHTHPAYAGPEQFNVIFPRPGIYRVWVQFKRLGVVNTAAFNLPVRLNCGDCLYRNGCRIEDQFRPSRERHRCRRGRT